MSVCPYANTSETCGLPSVNADQGSIVAYCQKCSEVVFRCASGHWNRAFARYCTQCRQELEKPAQWGMASANPQRTATLPKMSSVDALNRDYGFNTGVVNIPKINIDAGLPGILVIDGLIVVPNPNEKKLDAYTVANPFEQKNLRLKWSIPYDEALTYGATPVYHGFHLYYVNSAGIWRQPVVGGEVKPVELNDVAFAHIQPIPKCAPLKCYLNRSPTMIVGLEQGVLLLDLVNNEGNYIDHKFFRENTVMSPVQCREYIVFTTLQGQIFTLNMNMIGDKVPPPKVYRDISFSAPISLDGRVYFEALSGSGNRSLACFDPSSGKLSKAIEMDNDPKSNFENRQALFTHPPLTDGKRLFVSDRYGKQIYIYDIEDGYSSKRSLPQNGVRYMFAPHLSIVVNNRIYSPTSYGLTTLDLTQNYAAGHQSLAMGLPTAPKPIARPVRYGDKLFVLCEDRLLCLDC